MMRIFVTMFLYSAKLKRFFFLFLIPFAWIILHQMQGKTKQNRYYFFSPLFAWLTNNTDTQFIELFQVERVGAICLEAERGLVTLEEALEYGIIMPETWYCVSGHRVRLFLKKKKKWKLPFFQIIYRKLSKILYRTFYYEKLFC